MSKDTRPFLKHILNECEYLENMSMDLKFKEFVKLNILYNTREKETEVNMSRKRQLRLIKLVEITGGNE